MDTVKIVSQKIILKNEFYDHVIDRFFCLDCVFNLWAKKSVIRTPTVKHRKIDDRKITREQYYIFG